MTCTMSEPRATRRSITTFSGTITKGSWLDSIQSFVLSEATARFPEVAERGYLIIKEPNGSIGAPLLSEAMPASHVIFLVRDPRDVAASGLDAARRQRYENAADRGWKRRHWQITSLMSG